MPISTIGSAGINQAADTTLCTTSGNVGIGTSSPASKLHVAGSFRQTGATAPFEWTVNAGGLDYYKLNAVGYADNLIVANSGGNVGIGTSSPTARLTVVTGSSANNEGTLRVSDNATYYGELKRVNASDEVRLGSYGTSQNLTFYTVASERMRIDSSGNLLFNSGYGSVATAYGCRAWVNFNGTTSPGTIRASGNVTSVTKNGTGDYTINMTTALPDTNYAVVGTSAPAANSAKVVLWSGGTAPTTSLFRVFNDIASNLTGQDSSIMNVAVFR